MHPEYLQKPPKKDPNELVFKKGVHFLTITLDDSLQRLTSPETRADRSKAPNPKLFIKNRMKRIKSDYDLYVKPHLDEIGTCYHGALEISEALASKGKYFPRIHFHYIIKIDNPAIALMYLGTLQHMGYGYHLIPNLTDEQQEEKNLYIKKQSTYVTNLFEYLCLRQFSLIKKLSK